MHIANGRCFTEFQLNKFCRTDLPKSNLLRRFPERKILIIFINFQNHMLEMNNTAHKTLCKWSGEMTYLMTVKPHVWIVSKQAILNRPQTGASLWHHCWWPGSQRRKVIAGNTKSVSSREARISLEVRFNNLQLIMMRKQTHKECREYWFSYTNCKNSMRVSHDTADDLGPTWGTPHLSVVPAMLQFSPPPQPPGRAPQPVAQCLGLQEVIKSLCSNEVYTRQ